MTQQILLDWADLGPIWQDAFHLAWESLGRGTVPVGAVLVDESGVVTARGRNRIYEAGTVEGRLAGSRLAHAEVDALLNLDPEGWYTSYTLYSVLEPCLLCVGATVMSTVGTLLYASRDPYGGADGPLVGVNAHVDRVPLRLEGPLAGPFGQIGALLHVAYYLARKPEGYVVAAHKRQVPELLPAGRALLDEGILTAAQSAQPLEEFLIRSRVLSRRDLGGAYAYLIGERSGQVREMSDPTRPG